MKRVYLFICILFCLVPGARIKAMTAESEEMYEEIYQSISLEEMDEILSELEQEEVSFSMKQYVKDAMEGKTELSLRGIWGELKEQLQTEWENEKTLLFRLLLCGVLSGILLNFSTSMYEKQMGQTGFYIIYFFAVILIVAGFMEVMNVADKVLGQVLDFMRALVPSFSVALTWSTGSATAMMFYQAALSAIGIAQYVLLHIFVPLVQVNFLIGIVNPLIEGKFTKMAMLVQSIVRFGVKVMMVVLIGHQGIQGLITPALDGVKRTAVFRTANRIPGVGNLFGGVTDTVIGTSVLIKSAIGVGGLVAIVLLCMIPLIKMGMFTVVYKVLAAFTQPMADRRLVSVFQSAADSGKLLVHIVFMTAFMFFITLTIMIAATNRMI